LVDAERSSPAMSRKKQIPYVITTKKTTFQYLCRSFKKDSGSFQEST
jgi:hypothetical protein